MRLIITGRSVVGNHDAAMTRADCCQDAGTGPATPAGAVRHIIDGTHLPDSCPTRGASKAVACPNSLRDLT